MNVGDPGERMTGVALILGLFRGWGLVCIFKWRGLKVDVIISLGRGHNLESTLRHNHFSLLKSVTVHAISKHEIANFRR